MAGHAVSRANATTVLGERRSVVDARKLVVVLVAVVVAWCATARAAESDLSVNARLLLAARNGDAAMVGRMLKEGAAVNARNRLGETALLVALKKSDATIAKAMLDAGTDVNIAAVNGVTPLMAAAFTGQTELAAALL